LPGLTVVSAKVVVFAATCPTVDQPLPPLLDRSMR
jgi:hypothetical protein